VKENALREVYVNESKDLYSAENQLVKALPRMVRAATAPKLRAGSPLPNADAMAATIFGSPGDRHAWIPFTVLNYRQQVNGQ
jgi:hypothetical protein